MSGAPGPLLVLSVAGFSAYQGFNGAGFIWIPILAGIGLVAYSYQRASRFQEMASRMGWPSIFKELPTFYLLQTITQGVIYLLGLGASWMFS